jgi:hypothetical protein
MHHQSHPWGAPLAVLQTPTPLPHHGTGHCVVLVVMQAALPCHQGQGLPQPVACTTCLLLPVPNGGVAAGPCSAYMYTQTELSWTGQLLVKLQTALRLLLGGPTHTNTRREVGGGRGPCKGHAHAHHTNPPRLHGWLHTPCPSQQPMLSWQQCVIWHKHFQGDACKGAIHQQGGSKA